MQAFLRECDGEKVVMVADPPFGGLVKPLANSFSLISQTWRKLQSSGVCHCGVIFSLCVIFSSVWVTSLLLDKRAIYPRFGGYFYRLSKPIIQAQNTLLMLADLAN